jgi:glyoxylase-like metal-dependent hydrolase (beta-lactamase superfamily II)
MTQVEIILPGFPGKTSRGFLGFCNVSLIHSDIDVLFDTGHFSDRQLLLSELKRRKINVKDINYVILSHLHYDHCLNVDLFENATIILGEQELNYARSGEPEKQGDTSVPKFMLPFLRERQMIKVENELKLAGNVRVVGTPGHTPGSISAIVDGTDGRTVVAGDAVKNAYEFRLGKPEVFFGREEDARESISKISKIAEFIVPGHDRPFAIRNGKLCYQGELRLDIYTRQAPELEDWVIYSISTQPANYSQSSSAKVI